MFHIAGYYEMQLMYKICTLIAPLEKYISFVLFVNRRWNFCFFQDDVEVCQNMLFLAEIFTEVCRKDEFCRTSENLRFENI